MKLVNPKSQAMFMERIEAKSAVMCRERPPATRHLSQRMAAANPTRVTLVIIRSASQAGVQVEPGITVGGKYQVERPLARGGMGSVWVARHVKLGSSVAIKFLDAHLGVERVP